MSLPKRILEEKFRRFVEEDVGHGDVTTCYTVPPTVVEAEIMAKEKGVVAGIEEAIIFTESFGLKAKAFIGDGTKISKKTKILHIEGDASVILTIERTLLNLLSRMSGIATATNRLKEILRNNGYKTVLACTRKTAPGMSYFDKKAVAIGGGDPHRWGLDDMVLIKDNHIAIVGSIKTAVRKAQQKASFSKKIEVEVSHLTDVIEAAKAEADIIMLDNFAPKQAKQAVDMLKKNKLRNRVLVEASGGITERNLLEYASAGVDIISLGALTQSVKAFDISLEITKVRKSALK
jgi:nicotinate-nucleotide pyrophosphorylase (carboxylating)